MAESMEAVNDNLSCSICMEIYVEPKVLPCQHTFCFKCLKTLYAKEDRLRCPICRFDVRSIDALRPNIYIDCIVSQVLHKSEDDTGDDVKRHVADDGARQQNKMSRLTDTVSDCCQSTRQVCSNAVEMVWLFLQGLFIDMSGIYQKRLLITLAILCVINIGRLVAGAVKMLSSCSLEGHIGIFLFVKAMLAFFSWGCVLFFCLIKNLEEAARNSFVIIYYTLDMLFALSWLCYGTYLTFGVEDWDSCTQVNFYQFSRTLVSLDWIGCAVFVFYLLYRLCSDQRYDWYYDE